MVLTGTLAAIEPLRYTPAGVPLSAFRLLHRSQQMEAGVKRQVECEMNAVALGQSALGTAGLSAGQSVRVTGFLNRKNRMSSQLVLHATAIEKLEAART